MERVLPTHIVCAGAIIYRENNEILLIKNPRKGWEFPGGIIENGESIHEGLLREIKEETGIDAEVRSLVGIYSSVDSKQGHSGVKIVPTKVIIDFVLKYVDGKFIVNEEALEMKWFKEEEALEVINDKIKHRLYYAIYNKDKIILESHSSKNGKIEILSEYKLQR